MFYLDGKAKVFSLSGYYDKMKEDLALNYGRKGTMILFLCCVLFLAGCGSKSVQQQIVDEKEYDMTDQEIRKYLDSVIDGLIELEVVQESERQKLIDGTFALPSDMLHDMDKEQIVCMMLDDIGCIGYDFEQNKWMSAPSRIYSFDMEVGLGSMYVDTLMNLRTCTDGKIDISDVQEDFSHAEEDGMVGVDFCINGKQYHYDAKYQNDWFDAGILLYIGSILMQEENEQCLYGCSDGFQNLILFYETQEWIEQFADVTGICPEKFFLANDQRGESF